MAAPLARRDVTAIPLGRSLPIASSNQPGRRSGADPEPCGSSSSLFGLAPGGACRAASVAGRAVRSYRTFSPLPARSLPSPAVRSLWHFPWGRPRRTLSGTVFSVEPGLSSPLRERPSGRLAQASGTHGRRPGQGEGRALRAGGGTACLGADGTFSATGPFSVRIPPHFAADEFAPRARMWRIVMKSVLFAAALAAALPLAACNDPAERAAGGALVGGATGAAIGAAATGRGSGALAGAAIGAVGGAAVGAATAPRCARVRLRLLRPPGVHGLLSLRTPRRGPGVEHKLRPG